MRQGPEEQPSFSAENDVTRPLQMPQETAEALDTLADITGAKNFREFSEDAYRVYEMVIFEEAQGRTPFFLEQEDIDLLSTSDVVSGERDFLAPMIAEGKEEVAKAYFEKHKRRPQTEPKNPQELP